MMKDIKVIKIMKKKKIVIPDVHYCEDEDYQTIIDTLDSLPIDYEIWEEE